MMKKRKFIRLAIPAMLFLCFFASAVAAQSTPDARSAEKPLPNLILNTIEGKKWSLYENRGRVVLINFWATWCEPCRAETPMLVRFGKQYERRGLEIVGIALDDDGEGNIKKFVAEYAVDYPILLPVPGSRLSQIDPVPTTLLIDRQGRLAKKYVGVIPEKILRADLEKLIGETEAKPKR